ncbi:serine/threonine-protein kinase 17A [Tachysurus ichikawai]
MGLKNWGMLPVGPEAHSQILDSHMSAVSSRFCLGKFAVVKKCVERNTGREYAAKFMRKRRKGQDCRAEIIHEIAVLEQASSCHRVINLHEVYEMPSEMVLVLEL